MHIGSQFSAVQGRHFVQEVLPGCPSFGGQRTAGAMRSFARRYLPQPPHEPLVPLGQPSARMPSLAPNPSVKRTACGWLRQPPSAAYFYR
ncbi:hypothetical protein Mpe_B0032 (plasmid) [Methylibium petroleiphilum PM1]|uniref:Uncharacterized protein n=1 Tax=Methylibium petroleiphilum (strain ATCC BAA-1232 / LMG 22953 / PM1) TaxID=420662 RepID=A2SMM4_METPP|nr:hypothetical protein Mpe_B0032 [Methylibium petroleiphilum PM1]